MTNQIAELSTVFFAERGRLLRVVERILRDRSVAEDLVQETFLKVSTAAAQTKVADYRGYLLRAAANLARDHRRKKRVVQATVDAEAACLAVADSADSPESALAMRQALAAASGVLDRLPARTRHAFNRHRFDGRTMVQIGTELGISTTLVHKLVTEAYTAVRDELKAGGFLPPAAENSSR